MSGGDLPSDFAIRPARRDAELFCPPSPEMLRLQRLLPGLLAPSKGRGGLLARTLRAIVIAPCTQLTFFSFDLQMFLFDVLHVSRFARLSHGLGMLLVNLVIAALLTFYSQSLWGAAAFAGVLLLWYGGMALSVRLWRWWLVMVPIVAVLVSTGAWLGATLSETSLWILLAATATFVAIGHSTEPTFPPRAGDPYRWVPIPELIFGRPSRRPPLRQSVYWSLRVACYFPIGVLSELWASPRLLPYTVLRLTLMRWGYAPELSQLLDERRDRAWRSGNPALDFVGTGGGVFLLHQPRKEPSR